jgi:hypothetical protein
MPNFKTLQYGGWLYWIFFWVSPVAALILNIWVQLPGYAIAFMAVAAFIATFRDQIPSLQKLVWCIAVCGLFVAEIRAIRHDKNEQTKIEEGRRNEENEKFAKNVQEFEETLHQLRILRAQADTQDMWANQLLAQQAEKGQFFYVRVTPNGHTSREKEWNLELVNSGHVPLNDVRATILSFDNRPRQSLSLDTLPSSQSGPHSTNIRVPVGWYLVELHTRFDAFQERLRVLPDDKHPGGYIEDISITRDFDNKEIWQCCPPKDCLNAPCIVK